MKEDSIRRPSPCFLCNAGADVYCDSDAAFLCFSCDASVHGANFLVARHLRRLLCLSCHNLAGKSFSGYRSPPLRCSSCRSCSPHSETNKYEVEEEEEEDDDDDDDDDDDGDDEDSISCVSSTVTAPPRPDRRKRNIPVSFDGEKENRGSVAIRDVRSAKAEGILVNWCKELGLNCDSVLPVATRVFGLTSLPFRVGLAVSFWHGVRSRGVATWRSLRRLEEVSGVPGKLIVAVEMKLEHALRLRRRRRMRFTPRVTTDLEEGWAEC